MSLSEEIRDFNHLKSVFYETFYKKAQAYWSVDYGVCVFISAHGCGS